MAIEFSLFGDEIMDCDYDSPTVSWYQGDRRVRDHLVLSILSNYIGPKIGINLKDDTA